MGAQKVHLSTELASNEAAGVKMSTPSDVGDIAFSTNCLARAFCSDVLQEIPHPRSLSHGEREGKALSKARRAFLFLPSDDCVATFISR
jgi:hypothetical protein